MLLTNCRIRGSREKHKAVTPWPPAVHQCGDNRQVRTSVAEMTMGSLCRVSVMASVRPSVLGTQPVCIPTALRLCCSLLCAWHPATAVSQPVMKRSSGCFVVSESVNFEQDGTVALCQPPQACCHAHHRVMSLQSRHAQALTAECNDLPLQAACERLQA